MIIVVIDVIYDRLVCVKVLYKIFLSYFFGCLNLVINSFCGIKNIVNKRLVRVRLVNK